MKQAMRFRRFPLRSLSGLAFALYAFFGTGSTRLVCERLQLDQVACQQTNTHLYGLVKSSQTSLELSGARVESVIYDHNEHGIPLVRDEVWLESSQGTLTFPSLRYNQSRNEANQKAEQIRQYIQGEGAATLELSSGQPVLGQIVVTVVIGASLLLLNWLLTPKQREHD